MRKLTLALIAGVIAIAGLTLTTGTANAAVASPRCITKAEWRLIKPGMTRAQVTRIVDYPGRVTSRMIYGDGWSTDIDVEYRQCRADGTRAASWNTTWMSFDNYDWTMEIANDWHPMSVSYKGGWYTLY
jgi:hypothetical protein